VYFDKLASIINPIKGSISFNVKNHNLFEETITPITVDRYVIKDVEFLLQREPGMKLVFQHISPQYGTRISRLELNKVPKAREHMIVFLWSPEEIRIYMGVEGQGQPVQGDYIKVS
jgi:hypothetical protein